MGTPVRVDDEGLHFRAVDDASLDVYFGDQHVWSFPLRARASRRDDGFLVAWPKAMTPRLDGATRVLVRDAGRDVFDQECSFGSGVGRIEFRDANGVPLMIDKWGFVQRPFAGRDPAMIDQMMDLTEQILAILGGDCSLDAWVAFGSLLGAVRDGRLIGHDSDVDIAYLSRYGTPVDVTTELFAVARTLRAHGLRVVDKSGSFVTVLFDAVDGTVGSIDVYSCFYVGDLLHETATVRAPVPRSAILPLGTVRLEGRTLPAPADPDAVLAASYGPGWRTPDPSFRYRTPTSVTRRFGGWFGSLMRQRRSWESFYSSGQADHLAGGPTPFSDWVLDRLGPGTPVVEVGSGNGRDALAFAANGFPVLALDYARTALRPARERARRAGLDVRFRLLNLYDLRDVLSQGAAIAHGSPGPRAVYARFLLHALEPDGVENFWRFADLVLRGGGQAFVEFRTTADRDLPHALSGRQRWFLDPDRVERQVAAYGGRVVERVEDTGLAAFPGEDPAVCRMSVAWTR